jgi:hypothetical protein
VRADEIESQVWDRVLEGREYDRDLPDLLDALIRVRGSEDRGVPDDAIWALSLKIHVLLMHHDIEAAREAAALGERRLALRRAVLAGHPEELACSLRELAALYSFELEGFSPERARALEDEAAAIEGGGGKVRGG